MALFDAILSILGITLSADSALRERIKSGYDFEKLLSKVVKDSFHKRKENINTLVPNELIQFNQEAYIKALRNKNYLDIEKTEQLQFILITELEDNLSLSINQNVQSDVDILFEEIIEDALKSFWNEISKYDQLVDSILINRTGETNQVIKTVTSQLDQQDGQLKKIIEKISELSRIQNLPDFDKYKETAVPDKQFIGEKEFKNPFLLIRAEDFNHNYDKLANLFQSFPEWKSVQSRTENIFLTGGRGTGKSMILRRMSIQTTVSYYKSRGKPFMLHELSEDYYGIYIKLIRGIFEQYEKEDTIPKDQSILLAQHEFNIIVLEVFIDSISWLIKNEAVKLSYEELKKFVNDISGLFGENDTCNSLEEVNKIIIKEQRAIHDYFRDRTFNLNAKYSGKAVGSVSFITSLSRIFKKYFSINNNDFRLLLLIDEYEALTEAQQIAINTIIKMRLPDLTIKIALRKDSTDNRETFTPNEPIQDPRDFITISLDYDTNKKEFKELLKGICDKRLRDSGYIDCDIEHYLVIEPKNLFFPEEKINKEIESIWSSGKRRTDHPSEDFYKTYRSTAIHRILNKKNSPYPYYGFEQYKFLSFGIISSFMELCKFTFYFALYKRQDLHTNCAINPKIQNHSVYYVSKRLFNQISGNVQKVGPILKSLLSDIGEILRQRMLKHSSETECNLIELVDYDEHKYNLLPKLLSAANTWSVISSNDKNESLRAKNYLTIRTQEIIINRIYCPHLQMPARSRWPIKINSKDIEDLINQDQAKRQKAYKKIVQEVVEVDISDDDKNAQLSVFQNV